MVRAIRTRARCPQSSLLGHPADRACVFDVHSCRVKDLRQARGERLGALQRKFPSIGIALLYLLAAAELTAFPLLGAGTAGISELPELAPTISILELQSLIFASVSACLVLVLRIIQELWETSGGVFNVDAVLQEMVLGLEEELELRVAGAVRGFMEPPERLT